MFKKSRSIFEVLNWGSSGLDQDLGGVPKRIVCEVHTSPYAGSTSSLEMGRVYAT
jgi:hypothetical protein